MISERRDCSIARLSWRPSITPDSNQTATYVASLKVRPDRRSIFPTAPTSHSKSSKTEPPCSNSLSLEERLQHSPPPQGNEAEHTPKQGDVKMSAPTKCAQPFEVVPDRNARPAGDIDFVPGGHQDRELVTHHSLVVELSRIFGNLLDRVCAAGRPQLAIDRDEGDREGCELKRGPEPLRAWCRITPSLWCR